MIAARFIEARKPFKIEEVETPFINENEVLVEMKAAGICGSDVLYWSGDASPGKVPIILGHEGAGVVKEVGGKVHDLKVGDHVIIHYVISCGICKHCLTGYDNRCRNRISIGHDVNGTFAEYIKVPAKNAVKISDDIPFEWGAISSCAVATAYHAIKISNMNAGDTVVVFGVGGVGLHAIMWAKFFGAGHVIAVDVVNSKLETAKQYGADLTINASKEDVLEIIKRETDGWGAEVAIECSGSHKAIEQAIRSIKGRNLFESGTVICVGYQKESFQINYYDLREGCLRVSGDHTLKELQEIARLLECRRIELSKSISHRISLSEINDGIELLQRKDVYVERVVINKFR